MIERNLASYTNLFLLTLACCAAALGLVVFQHRDDEPGRPGLAQGTALDVYWMRCTSAGNVAGEHPDWHRYEISYDPAEKQFTMQAGGKATALPSAMVAGPVSPDNTDYFMVLTHSQLNTAYGVSIVNVQAVLPMKAGLASQPLSFRMSIPHGQVLRADACTALD